jgi:hypothetical protein
MGLRVRIEGVSILFPGLCPDPFLGKNEPGCGFFVGEIKDGVIRISKYKSTLQSFTGIN